MLFVMLVHKLGKETRRTVLQLQTIVCGKTVDMSVQVNRTPKLVSEMGMVSQRAC